MECFVTIDNEGRVTACSGSTEIIFGRTQGKMIGTSVVDLMPEHYRSRHKSARAAWVTTGEKHAMGSWMEVEALKADGSEVPISMVLTERDGEVTAIMRPRTY
jgi:PAS domain S-box-containing protein